MQNFKMSASEYLRCAPKYTISRLNNQNFSGEGAQPPAGRWRGTPLPTPYPLRRSSPHSKILATPPDYKTRLQNHFLVCWPTHTNTDTFKTIAASLPRIDGKYQISEVLRTIRMSNANFSILHIRLQKRKFAVHVYHCLNTCSVQSQQSIHFDTRKMLSPWFAVC